MAIEHTEAQESVLPVSEGLFVRKSSGLVRELGIRHTIGINLSVLLLIGFFTNAAVFLQAFPNGDFYIPLLVGAFASLVLAFAYTQLVALFPRSGGEYVYASRVFTPLAGAAVGGALLITLCLASAFTVVATGQIFVPFAFTAIGTSFHIHALVAFGSTTAGSKTAWLVTGLVMVALFAAVSLRPIATIGRWIFWAFAMGLVAFFLMVVILLFETHTGFVHAFNHASGAAAYEKIIRAAQVGGFHPGITTAGVIAMLPIGALGFSGFTYGNYAAGELKRPLRTYGTAVFVALGVGLVAGMLGWLALRHTVGLNFLQASAKLQASNPAEYGKLTSVPELQGGLAYATLAAGDPVSSSIIAIGVLLAEFANGLAFVALCSRVVFALSFDRLLPTKLADVHKGTNAPIYSVLLVAFGVTAFTVIGDETSLLSLFRNLVLIGYVIFVIGSVCAAVLPFRRPDLFEGAPRLFRRKILGVPLASVFGTLSALAFAGLGFDIATKTAYNGGYSTSSVITLVVVATIGAACYVIARVHLDRRGIDLRLSMRELPPE
jgi:amino acid transporter